MGRRRSRCPGWPEGTRRGLAWTPARTAPHWPGGVQVMVRRRVVTDRAAHADRGVTPVLVLRVIGWRIKGREQPSEQPRDGSPADFLTRQRTPPARERRTWAHRLRLVMRRSPSYFALKKSGRSS